MLNILEVKTLLATSRRVDCRIFILIFRTEVFTHSLILIFVNCTFFEMRQMVIPYLSSALFGNTWISIVGRKKVCLIDGQKYKTKNFFSR